jgi:hypothetical protein
MNPTAPPASPAPTEPLSGAVERVTYHSPAASACCGCSEFHERRDRVALVDQRDGEILAQALLGLPQLPEPDARAETESQRCECEQAESRHDPRRPAPRRRYGRWIGRTGRGRRATRVGPAPEISSGAPPNHIGRRVARIDDGADQQPCRLGILRLATGQLVGQA